MLNRLFAAELRVFLPHVDISAFAKRDREFQFSNYRIALAFREIQATDALYAVF